MDYSKVLVKYYPQCSWSCGETYESLKWKDKTTEKPTEEELNVKWEELKKRTYETRKKSIIEGL